MSTNWRRLREEHRRPAEALSRVTADRLDEFEALVAGVEEHFAVEERELVPALLHS